MKKTLLLVLLTVFTLQTQATHLMGGQITSKNIGGLTYQVTLTLYRDTLGISMYPTEDIYYQDSLGITTIAMHTLSYTNMYPLGNGVEKYEYIDTITFPVVGRYEVWTSNGNRNAAIINIPNANFFGMYLDVTIYADSTNSSPVFLNDPTTVAQLNQPFSYNPLPYDSDGDSLSWVLETPLDIDGIDLSGYVLPSSDTLVPFSIDSLTGEITFLPNLVGNFQISVRALEWRNGVQIGYIRRDMQLIVIASNNIPTQIQVNANAQISTANPIYINVNNTLTFDLTALNIDTGSVFITIGGSALLNTTATSTLTTESNNEAVFTINWTPLLNEVREDSYYLSFRVGDYNPPFTFYNDYTYRIIVTNSITGISEVTGSNKKYLIKSVDMLGRNVNPNQEGFRINIYSDGSNEKIYIKN